VHIWQFTVLRVLAAERLVLPGRPAREPAFRTSWLDRAVWPPNTIWCLDFTPFTPFTAPGGSLSR